MQTASIQLAHLEQYFHGLMAFVARNSHVLVVYHRPDFPGLIQEFIQEFGQDVITIPKELTQAHMDLQSQLRESQVIETEEHWDLIQESYQRLESLSKAFTRRVVTLPTQIDVSFDYLERDKQEEIIGTVPLERVQKFLRHWLYAVDGPMKDVTIVQQPCEQDMKLIARIQSQFSDNPSRILN